MSVDLSKLEVHLAKRSYVEGLVNVNLFFSHVVSFFRDEYNAMVRVSKQERLDTARQSMPTPNYLAL